MTLYEALCVELNQQGVEVYEVPLLEKTKGLYSDNVIWINQHIKSEREKACVLAEEHGHYLTTAGNILDQCKLSNRKQEQLARRKAYEKLIPLQRLVEASREGIRNRYELAEYLDVTEDFLEAALSYYKGKYGLFTKWTSYIIYFEPLGVFESYE